MWFRSKMKSYLLITRSVGLNGTIPHFAHAEKVDDLIIIVDYIPVLRKDNCCDNGESFVLFNGTYRTSVYKLQSEVINTSHPISRESAIALAQNK